MDFRRPLGLLRKVHGDAGMAVPAFKAVIRFKTRPFVLGKPNAMIEKLSPSVDCPENVSPDLDVLWP